MKGFECCYWLEYCLGPWWWQKVVGVVVVDFVVVEFAVVLLRSEQQQEAAGKQCIVPNVGISEAVCSRQAHGFGGWFCESAGTSQNCGQKAPCK